MVEPLDLSRPHVDPSLVLRMQKYRKLDRVSPVVKELAREAAILAEALAEPRGWMRREPMGNVGLDGNVRIGGGIEFHSLALARLLRKATEAVLVVLTIGPDLEQRVQRLVDEGQLVEGLLLDTAGWVAIDAMMKNLRQWLERDARSRALRLSGRMAPGFKDFALDQQRILFGALAEGRLTVHLTEACVMLPLKSVSGVYGLIPGATT